MKNLLFVLTVGLIILFISGGFLSGCSSGISTLKTSKWKVESLDGTQVMFSTGKSITFDIDAETGKITGKAPCNGYSCSYDEYPGQLKMNAIISTKMACDELTLETQYFTALGKVTSYKISGNYLSLYSGNTVVVRLVKQ